MLRKHSIISTYTDVSDVNYAVDQKKYEELRQKWFKGLADIAGRYPDLFPIGLLEGVMLNVVPKVDRGRDTGLLEVRPVISKDIPSHIEKAVRELFHRLFNA